MTRSVAYLLAGLALAACVALALTRPWESPSPAESVAGACESPGADAPSVPDLPAGEVAIVIDVCAIVRRHDSPASVLPVTATDVVSGPQGVVETLEFGRHRAGDGPGRTSDDRLRPQGDVTVVEVAFKHPVPRTGDGSRPFETTPGAVEASGTRLFRMGGSGPADGRFKQAHFWVEDGMDVRYLAVVVAEHE